MTLASDTLPELPALDPPKPFICVILWNFVNSRSMKKAEVIDALSALAHPARMDVFRLLVVAGPDGMTPGALMKALNTDKAATMSTYLRDLGIPGLVTQERVGRNLVYRAAYDRMNGVLGFLTENCCKGVAQDVVAHADSCGC